MKKCGNCDKEFEPKRHNAVYCSPECGKKATNKKILERYKTKKQKPIKKKRVCNSCAETVLSIYNVADVCHLCVRKEEQKNIDKLLRELGANVK